MAPFSTIPSRRPNGVLAFGLQWLAAEPGDIKHQARATARTTGDSLICARVGPDPQFAIASPSEGHRSGQVAAAAAAAAILPPTALVAQQIDQRRWWLLLVDDGQIVVDRVFPDEIHCRTAFNEEMAGGRSVSRIVCPESWSIDGGEAANIVELAREAGGPALEGLNSQRNWRIGLLLAAIASVTAGTEFIGKGPGPVTSVWRLAFPPPPPPPPIPPWQLAPDPWGFVLACAAVTDPLLARTPSGWSLETIECGIGGAKARYRRTATNTTGEYGSVDAVAVFAREFDGRLSFEQQALYATVDVGARLQRPAGRASAPRYPVSTLSTEIWRLGVAAGGASTISRSAMRAPAAGSGGKPPQRIFSRSMYAVRSRLPLSAWQPLLTLPGLTFEKASYTPRDKQWKIEGYIYDPL